VHEYMHNKNGQIHVRLGNYKVIELCIFCLGGNENIQQNGT